MPDKELKDYMDEQGFVGHLNYDGTLEFGDGAQRLGLLHLANWFCWYQTSQYDSVRAVFKETIQSELAIQINLIERADDGYVRHWDKSKWPGQPGTLSRDNFTSLFCAVIMLRMRDQFWDLTDALLSRFGFFWNTKHIGQKTGWKIPDFAGPETYGLIIRGLIRFSKLGFLLYPLLWLTDLALVFSSFSRIWMSYRDPDDTSNDTNHIPRLLVAYQISPTPVSLFAHWIYEKFRKNAGLSKESRLDGPSGPQTALDHYFRGEKNPPLNNTMRPICFYLFGERKK